MMRRVSSTDPLSRITIQSTSRALCRMNGSMMSCSFFTIDRLSMRATIVVPMRCAARIRGNRNRASTDARPSRHP
jgi:hypothetical protein